MKNLWPNLDERYDAARAENLGDQLSPEELTPRIKASLENAFADGALWQYYRSERAS